MPYSKAYDPNSCGYDVGQGGSWKEGVYTRVHRDMDIVNAMRKWQGLAQANDASSLGLPANCNSASPKEFLAE